MFEMAGTRTHTVPKELVGYLPEERGLYREARVMQILLFLASLKMSPGMQPGAGSAVVGQIRADRICQCEGRTAFQGHGSEGPIHCIGTA